MTNIADLMKIKTIVSILAIMGAAHGHASPLTPEEALLRVERHPARGAAPNEAAPRYIGAWEGTDGEAALYLYTYSGSRGFLLLSADDVAAPLVGYSETNGFSLTDAPESLTSWLSFYSLQIEEARLGGCEAQPVAGRLASRADMAPIAPMIQTRWDQGAPYNNECPLIGGRRCVTGCVATAMAQVMKYWEYPAKGQGSTSYWLESIKEDLSMDFASTTFDWATMKDSYGKKVSASEAHSVSTLMKACGYSVRMRYTPGESGAYSKDIPTALTTYFGYDKGVKKVDRGDYKSQDDWNRMIYDQLVSSGPVIYSGQSNAGGHCFVCDGYDGNGYFHINWGWSGMSDGYFLLGELTPKEVGTGGHYGGYNIYQDAVVGIMPPVGRLTLETISIDNAADDSGSVKGWGYTYRIKDFSNILLSVKVKIAGGHISSPLYYTVYETDPETKKNGAVALDAAFDSPLNASEGNVTCTTRLKMTNYDPAKLYTLNVAYDLKGTRTTIGSIRMAASSGVDDIATDGSTLRLFREGDILRVSSAAAASVTLYSAGGAVAGHAAGTDPAVDLSRLDAGLYVARATDADGSTRTLRLLLK